MADVIGLTSDIGTWLAILLALIALIGIVGPILVLRRSRSERNQALKAIDSRKTGYVTRSFLFRLHDVHAPQLEKPPTFRTSLRPSDNVATLDLSSSSGWINLAALIEFYTPGLTRSNKIHIYDRCAWLPCHRFWLFAIGLRGKYGDRPDRGEDVVHISPSRLRIQAEGDDDEGGYGTQPATGKLHGSTGTLWWKRSLNPTTNESVMDQIYFAPKRPVTGHAAGLDISISTLFWLSMGCLPLKHPDGRVFDLKRGVKEYHSRPRRDEDLDYAPETSKLSGTFGRFVSTGDGDSMWANATGADMKNRWYLKEDFRTDISKRDFERELEAERGNWYQTDSGVFIWKSDIHCLALALLHLEISPKGFLFDHRNSLFDFIHRGRVILVTNLLRWTLRGAPSMNIREKDVQKFRVSLSWWESWEVEMPFSRQEAQDFYEMDEMFRDREWGIPLRVQHIIAVLAICSETFQKQLEEVANTNHNMCTISIEVDSGNNLVRTAITGSEPFEHSLDFSTIFPDYEPTLPISPITYNQHFDIMLSALRGYMRRALFCHSLNSKELVELIQGLEDIVYLSPSDQAPRLHQIGENHGVELAAQPPRPRRRSRRRSPAFTDRNSSLTTRNSLPSASHRSPRGISPEPRSRENSQPNEKYSLQRPSSANGGAELDFRENKWTKVSHTALSLEVLQKFAIPHHFDSLDVESLSLSTTLRIGGDTSTDFDPNTETVSYSCTSVPT